MYKVALFPAYSVIECSNGIVIQSSPTAASSRLQAHWYGRTQGP